MVAGGWFTFPVIEVNQCQMEINKLVRNFFSLSQDITEPCLDNIFSYYVIKVNKCQMGINKLVWRNE